ncbi:MAG: hypothetical protein D6714_02955 [Bacteroidetes bacterium]|nr:MAG: hypothetical protein D6714_02955 [Bacteroidota bacterium]
MTPLTKFLLLFTFCLSACNLDTTSKAPDNTLFANFYVRFLQPEKQVKAEATFFLGEDRQTARPFSVEGGVAFQGSGMGARTLPDGTIRYNYENALSWPGAFVFQFKDPGGKIQKQSVGIEPVGSFSVASPASQTKGLQIRLESTPLKKGQTLVALISDQKAKTVSFILESDNDTAQCSIPPQKLAELSPGKATLYLVKKEVKTIQNPGYLAQTTIEYYSNNYTFELAP